MTDFADHDIVPVPPPPSALILFDGKEAGEWIGRNGQPFPWRIEEDFMEVIPGKGDIRTRKTFRNFHLHLEFRLPYMPAAKGQDRANSGVYLQGLYEIQILDSFNMEPADNACGALYKIAAPMLNACKKPEKWQSYDILFKHPVFNAGGSCVKQGAVSVLQNGIAIHNHLEFHRPTGAGLSIDPRDPGPVLLQDHGNRIRFRNIWLIEHRSDHAAPAIAPS